MNGTTNLPRVKQSVFVALGLLCVGLGTVGIFVPGLPTTVFLLAASWLFVRSSPRLNGRLHAHPRLGGFLQRAREGRMPLRARIVSILGIWGGIGVAIGGPAVRSDLLAMLLVVSGIAGTLAVSLFARGTPTPH